MARPHLPAWLYEPLPYVYMASGLGAWIGLRGILAFISGIILIGTGLTIWYLRRAHRYQAMLDQAGPQTRMVLEEEVRKRKTEKLLLVWKNTYETGHEIIDRQHRRLFSVGNELIEALLARQTKADIELRIADLLDHIVEHFHTEEEILRTRDPKAFTLHRDQHLALLGRIRELQTRYHQGQLSSSELLGFITQEAIGQHIRDDDMQLFNVPATARAG